MKKLDIALLVIIVPLFCWGGYWAIKTFGLIINIKQWRYYGITSTSAIIFSMG